MPDQVALLDIEQGGKTGISDTYWLTDITISYGSWSYTKGQRYKTPDLVIRNMIDVWSKKGIVLLNISPRADGVIPDEQQQVLREIGNWINRHKEAVYDTRTHKTFGYGKAEFEEGHFGGQSATMSYTKDDVRFTVSKDGKALFVYLLGLPEPESELELHHVFESNVGQEISKVIVVGSNKELSWNVKEGDVFVEMPEAAAMDSIATVLKLEFKN